MHSKKFFNRRTSIFLDEDFRLCFGRNWGRWDKYNKRRVLICQVCGKKLEKMTCRECGAKIKIRQHILTDFIIGAYALQTEGQKIVTRDKGYYLNYFPELTIISTDP